VEVVSVKSCFLLRTHLFVVPLRLGFMATPRIAVPPIPVPPRDRKTVATEPCALCGAPGVIIATSEDGAPLRICADHLPPEARAVYDRLRYRGWRAPAPQSRALFEAHPHGQRCGRRIMLEFDGSDGSTETDGESD
jgi:hypothetical protein